MLLFLLSSADTLMKAKAYIRGFKEKIVGEVWLYQLSDMRVVLKGRVEGLGKERTYAIPYSRIWRLLVSKCLMIL